MAILNHKIIAGTMPCFIPIDTKYYLIGLTIISIISFFIEDIKIF